MRCQGPPSPSRPTAANAFAGHQALLYVFHSRLCGAPGKRTMPQGSAGVRYRNIRCETTSRRAEYPRSRPGKYTTSRPVYRNGTHSTSRRVYPGANRALRKPSPRRTPGTSPGALDCFAGEKPGLLPSRHGRQERKTATRSPADRVAVAMVSISAVVPRSFSGAQDLVRGRRRRNSTAGHTPSSSRAIEDGSGTMASKWYRTVAVPLT